MNEFRNENTKFGTVSMYVGLSQIVGYSLYLIFTFTVAGAKDSMVETFFPLLVSFLGLISAIKGLRNNEKQKMHAHLGLAINAMLLFLFTISAAVVTFEYFMY